MAQVIGIRTTLKRINSGALQQVGYDQLKVAWALAARAFVVAATRRVLVETGMSAATFFPLSRAISQLRVGANTTPFVTEALKRKTRPSAGDRPEFPSGDRRGRIRSVRTGEREGKRAFRFNVGSRKRPFFNFFFQTVVYQFAVNDATRTRALAAGERAFVEVFEANVGRAEDAITNFIEGGSARALPPGDVQAFDARF